MGYQFLPSSPKLRWPLPLLQLKWKQEKWKLEKWKLVKWKLEKRKRGPGPGEKRGG
jgi:hypothetical protein